MKLNSLLKNISNHLGNYSKKVLLSVILVLLCFWVWGGNYRLRSSVTNGNWSDTIWQYSSLGITWSDDNRIPGNGDIVYIQNGSGGTITIDLTSDITVNELHIDSDNKGGTVIINTNGYTLTANNLYIGKKDSTTTEGDIELIIVGPGSIDAANIKAASSNSGKTNTVELNNGATLNGTVQGGGGSFTTVNTTSIWSAGSWDVTPSAVTKTLVFEDDFTIPDATFLSSLTELTSITINNSKTLDLASENFNTSLLAANSDGLLKTTGTVTVGSSTSDYQSPSLSINAGTITATSKHLSCKSVTANTTNLAGNSAINTTDISSFGTVNVSGSSTTNINCAASHTISAINMAMTGASLIVWGGAANTGVVSISGNITKTGGSNNNITFKNPVEFTGGSTYQIKDTTSVTFEKTCTADSSFTFDNAGNVSINDFTMNGVAGTLTLNSDITVSGTLTLKGTAATPLTITTSTSNTVTLTNNQDSGEYLNITAANAPTITGASFLATNSTTDDIPALLAKGWIFSSENDSYWTGATDTDWGTASNWLPSAIPVATANIIINSNAINRYPVLNTPDSSSTSITSLSMEAGTGIAAVSELIITSAVDFANDVTVSGKITSASGITTSANVTINGNSIFSGNVTNTGSITVNSGNTLSFDADFDDSASTASTSGSLKFTGTGSFTPAAGTSYTSLELDCSGNTVTAQNAFTADYITITNGTLSSAYTTTVNTSLTNNGTVSGTGDYEILSDITDYGTWSSTGIIKLNGTGNQTFVPKAGTSYKIEVNKTSGTMSFNTNTLTASQVTLTAGTQTAFNAAVAITSLSDNAVSGNITFAGGGTISSVTTFNTTGTITFSGNTTLDFGTNAVTHTAGSTVLNGKIKTSELRIGSGSLTGNSEVDGSLTFTGGTDAAHRNEMSRTGGTLKVSGNIEVDSAAFYTLGTSAITITPITAGNIIIFTNNGNLEIPHSSKITADFINNGTLLAGGSSATSVCKITGDFTNNGSMAIPDSKYFSVTGTVDDSAGTAWNAAGETGTLQFSGTANQTFNAFAASARTYSSLEVKLSNGISLSVNNDLTATKFKFTSGDVIFNNDITIGSYSETDTPSGNITFSANGTFSSATTITTTGTVTVAAGKTLAINNGAATPLDADFTHTSGTTAVNGELKALAINLGATTVNGNGARITGNSITTGTITGTADNTDELILTSATGSFTTGQAGTPAISFKKLTFDAGLSADLTFSDKNLYTNALELKIDDSKKLILNGTISITGSGGFVSPLKSDSTPFPVELSGATSITTSGPVTLYDNLTGGQNLTVTNTGIFTLLETSATADPADETSLAATSAATGSFTQNGTGNVALSGDITASGSISFAGAVTLSDNVKLVSSASTITFSNSINDAVADTHFLVTSSSGSTEFTGTNSVLSCKALYVPDGTLVINKTSSINTFAINAPITAGSSFTLTQGTVTGTGKITVKGNFTDNGIWTGSGDIELSGTADQAFIPGSTSGSPSVYNKIIVNKQTSPASPSPAGTVTFNTRPLSAANLTLTACSGVIFNQTVNISTLSDSAYSGNITFAADAVISSATTFNTTGTVQFGNTAASSISFGTNSVTHTAGNTEIAGSLTASEVEVYNLSLLTDSTISTTTTDGLKLTGGADSAHKNSLSGNYTLTSAGNITTSAFYEINTTNITFSPLTNTLTNKGDLSLVSTTITGLIDNTSANNITVNNDSSLDGSLTNNGTFTLSANITFQLSKNFTNNAAVIANAGSTFRIINSSANPDISEIRGDSTFQNFTCTAPGKTISFENAKTQTVNGKLTLTGNTGNLIYLRSLSNSNQWKINCTGTHTPGNPAYDISYVDVKDSNNTSSYRFDASNSVDSQNNIRWNFTTVAYTWNGSQDSNWFNQNNWDKGSVPGIGVNVIIPDKSTVTYSPVLNHDLENSHTEYGSVGSTGNITIEPNGEIDFAACNLTANSITNNGRIRLAGNQTITKTSVENKPVSIVEYYGECSSNQMSGNTGSSNYANLIFSDGASGTITGAVNVSETTTIANGTGKALTLSGANTFTGLVTIGQTSPAVTGGTLVINATSDLTIAAGALCDSLAASVTSGDSGKTITLEGSLTSTGTVTLTGRNVNTAGGTSGSPAVLTVPGNLTINANYQNNGYIQNNAETQVNGSITNNGEYKANSNTSFTANFTDSGTWQSSNQLILNGNGAQEFTANTSTTYEDIYINKTSGSSAFTNNVKIQTVTDTAASGDITFLGDSVFTNDVTFLTAGTVQFGSSAASVTTFGLASPYKKLTRTAGTVTIYGSMTAYEAELGLTNCSTDLTLDIAALTVHGNVTTSASYIKLNGNLTAKNAITITPNIMLNGSLDGDGNAVLSNNLYIFAPSVSPAPVTIDSVTVNGDLIFNRKGNVNTKGHIKAGNLVQYTGNITSDAGSSLEAVKDIVLLGANYNLSNSNSGNSQEFVYQQARLSPVNYLRADFNGTGTPEDKMPDGTVLPSASAGFDGTYTAGAGAELKAGKNFYANGTSFTAASTWFIGLPDITDSSNGFTEAVFTSVTYSTIRCNADSSTDGSKSRMPAYFCTDNGNNVNWLFEDFEIAEVHTVRDNVLRITFTRAVRNINSELINSIARFSNNTDTYSGFYTDADCKNPLTAVNVADGIIYIKSDNSWNTDATGKSAGTALSTDRSGIHKEVIPYIQIRNLTQNSSAQISDIWGKRLGNYDGNNRFTDVTDKTGPVLYSVRTGQNSHTQYDSAKGPSSQPSYDGHNFIEFRYSEKVNFGDTASATPGNENTAVFDNTDASKPIWLPAAASTVTQSFPDIDNVRSKDSFGAVTNDITVEGNINLAGLGIIASGLIHTGTKGATDKYVNAFYRKDEYSINISIAGYTEGTVSDRNGNLYKNWTGYIENGIQPSGEVTMNASINNSVTDCAIALDGVTPLYNPQEKYEDNQVIPVVNQVYATNTPYINEDEYGDWDISAPVFTPLRLDPESAWEPGEYYEAVGNTSGMGSTLDKIEFHLFDNTPSYSSSDTAIWLTEKGWIKNALTKNFELYDESFSYTADIAGGSRPFHSDETQRTQGGIRYSTITSSTSAFKYIDSQVNNIVPNKSFDTTENGVYIGAKASLFVGSSALRRAADSVDGLYFGLHLTDTDLPVSRSFTVSYDDTKGYITDLAGNRLRSATFKTIDRTPPSYDLFLSPLNQNELYMVFVKKLSVTADTLKYRDNNGNQIKIEEAFETLIPRCFELFTLDSDGKAVISDSLQIDYSVPAKIEEIVSNTNGSEFTVIRLRLTGNTTLPAIENMYVRLKYADGYKEFSQDPITSINDSRVTFIQDSFGNYMPMYQAHSLSDFAISSVNPLYAYDTDMIYNDEVIMNNFYGEGTWAVHDWNEEQQNYGTLPANHPFAIVSNVITGTDNPQDLPSGVRIFLSNNPVAESISAQYNSDFNKKIRVWLPEVTNGLLPAMSLKNNPVENYFQTDSVIMNPNESLSRIQFNIPKEISQSWGPNQQISFIFGILNSDGTPLRIYNSPYYNVTSDSYDVTRDTPVPLYSIRLKDPSDITSLDLWSFKTRSITEQRGGVTILNNVINATTGEKTLIKVNMPADGKLNVMVMTIDGNIITYLQHGQTEAGEHYYSWDGKNGNKGTVARGIYFIRVVGNGLDETRKVMVVK